MQNCGADFARACRVERHIKMSQEHARATSHANLEEKGRGPAGSHRGGTLALCEPARLKSASRFHKSHFIRKFAHKKVTPQSEHLDQVPAFTPTVRTPQCGHTAQLRLMKLNSTSLSPETRVVRSFSRPARSTKKTSEVITVLSPPWRSTLNLYTV